MSPFPAPHPQSTHLFYAFSLLPRRLTAPFRCGKRGIPPFFCTADPTGRWDEGREKEPTTSTTRRAPKNFFFLGAPLLSLFRSNEGDFFCAHFSSFCWRAVRSFAQGFQKEFSEFRGILSLPRKKRHESGYSALFNPPFLDLESDFSDLRSGGRPPLTLALFLLLRKLKKLFVFVFLFMEEGDFVVARSLREDKERETVFVSTGKRISLCCGVSLAALSLQHLPKRPPLLIRDRVTLSPP